MNIALLGQPNSGKSTVFNELTGMRQHVGNWPGKTVEQKEGKFTRNGEEYSVMDLPGSYSLLANSEEEIITRDYIKSKKADLVIIMADASQLERSLYMVSDYAMLNTPAILVLNMMDVAKIKGKSIDCNKISDKLGIPVIPFVAADKNEYNKLFEAIDKVKNDLKTINAEKLKEELSKVDKNNVLESGKAKYAWIDWVLAEAVTNDKKACKLGKFDRIAISPVWGKPFAIITILICFVLGYVVGMPVMLIGKGCTLLCEPLTTLLTDWGTADFIISIVAKMIPNILYFSLSMSGFVLGITFVFNLVEEVGYMARLSYIFDNWMSGLRLQGKSIMAFFMGAGCTMGGAAGTRVIDSWGQRILALTLVWAVPCGATWSLMPTLASIFFGAKGAWVMVGILIMMVFTIWITAKIFAPKVVDINDKSGMIMELPPYHKPRWSHLFSQTIIHAFDVFKRAFRVVFLVGVVFWALSYSSTGNVENTVLYKVGSFIEPVTMFFGLRWQTFMAFMASAFSKEAVLGVLSSLFANTGGVFESTLGMAEKSSSLGEILPGVMSKAEALAFITSVTFNVPCIMAVAATYRELHSVKWTVKIALYYEVFALIMAGIVYHIALLFL